MADPQVDRTLSYEQLEWLVKDRERQRDEALKLAREKESEIKRLRLVLRGMTDEHFTLKVNIAPEVLMSGDVWDAVQAMLKSYVGQTAHAFEQKIGGPLRRLQEALMHIHYLENHARNRGLQFTEWAVTERDKELWY